MRRCSVLPGLFLAVASWSGVRAGRAVAAPPAVPSVELRIELPDGVTAHRAFWGVKQGGRVVADGVFDCAGDQTKTVSTAFPSSRNA